MQAQACMCNEQACSAPSGVPAAATQKTAQGATALMHQQAGCMASACLAVKEGFKAIAEAHAEAPLLAEPSLAHGLLHGSTCC